MEKVAASIMVGDVWKTKEGHEVKIIGKTPGVPYPLIADNGVRYSEEGEFWKGDFLHPLTLVEPVCLVVEGVNASY